MSLTIRAPENLVQLLVKTVKLIFIEGRIFFRAHLNLWNVDRILLCYYDRHIISNNGGGHLENIGHRRHGHAKNVGIFLFLLLIMCRHVQLFLQSLWWTQSNHHLQNIPRWRTNFEWILLDITHEDLNLVLIFLGAATLVKVLGLFFQVEHNVRFRSALSLNRAVLFNRVGGRGYVPFLVHIPTREMDRIVLSVRNLIRTHFVRAMRGFSVAICKFLYTFHPFPRIQTLESGALRGSSNWNKV